MIPYALLFALLLNSCLSISITSTVDAYETAIYSDVSEGKVQYISPDGCIATYYDGDYSESTTLIPCPSDINEVPQGCLLVGCCKTVCPPGRCSWITTGSEPGQSSKSCDSTSCIPWSASGAQPRLICSGDYTPPGSPSPCVKTITTSEVITSYYTTVVTTDCGTGGDDGVSIPSGCGTFKTVISSTSHTYTTCTGSVSPPPGCFFSTTMEFTSLLVCGEGCTKTFGYGSDATTVTFESCPPGEITPPPGFDETYPTQCSEFNSNVYCPEYCDTFAAYEDYYGTPYTFNSTTCEGTSECSFVTAFPNAWFECSTDYSAPCTKKFTSEGQTTTVTLSPCPTGEITAPPGFPAEIIGCTTISGNYFCPERCSYYDTTWSYYNTYITKFITSCDTSGCEVVTTSGRPSYSCPPAEGAGTPCTKTFSTTDRSTTVTFQSCPSGEITAPPGFYPFQPAACSAYSGSVYCPDYCYEYYAYDDYYGSIYIVTSTMCEGSTSCDFITTGAYPSFDCEVAPGEACTKKFTADGQTTTVMLSPCPSGEITPPPNFPAEIIGCTTYSGHYFCPEKCEYYSTSWPYYNTYVSAFITSCDNSGCEIVTGGGNPSYNCPTESIPDYPPYTPTPCTRTFSHEDRTTTVTFENCPSGEITPPPELTIPPQIGCTTYNGGTYCPDNCILSGTFINYYGTPYNYIYSVCDPSGCEFDTSGTPSYNCPATCDEMFETTHAAPVTT